MRWAQAIELVLDVLRPSSTPVTTTLDEAGAVTSAFTSKSSIVPITFQVIESADFNGFLGVDIKLTGDTWTSIWPEAPIVQIPEGGQIRARLLSLAAGTVTVSIIQGRIT